MSTLLQKINETLTQLNEVEDLRNVNKNNKLKSLIDLLKNPQTNINLGLKIGDPDELWTNSKNQEWNKLYVNAAQEKLIINGDVNFGDQYILKLQNVYQGKNKLDNKVPDSGYIKFAADSLSKFNRNAKDSVKKWANSLTNAFTTDDFTLVKNKQEASVLSKEDILEIQQLFKRLIKVSPTPSDENKAWFFDKNVSLSYEKLYSNESARAKGIIPADFIMKLYFYLFAGEEPHHNLPDGASTEWDSKIENYYKESNQDKVKTWSGLVRKNANLTNVNYAKLIGKDEANKNLIENVKKLKVGGKTVESIWGEENLEDLTSKLDTVKNYWKISDDSFTQDKVNNSFILAAFLGGLCKNLTNDEILNLPELSRRLKNQFREIKPEYKNRFNSSSDFAQSILLNTSNGSVGSKYEDQDWENYLESGEINGKYETVPSTDQDFTSFTIRNEDEIRNLLNEVFKDDDLDNLEETGNLFLLIKPSDGTEPKAVIKLIKSDDNDNILIPDNKTLPENYNTFEFNSNDQLNICYAARGQSPSWNVNNRLTSPNNIKGTIGAVIKTDKTTKEPIIDRALKFDLSKLQIIVDDSEDLAHTKIISIDSGTAATTNITDEEETTTGTNDGSENLTPDQIKEAVINWLWSKRPTTLKTQEDVRKFIMKEYNGFEDSKKSVIDEVVSKPDYYTYDENLKTFTEVNSQSELQKLLNKLNDTSRGTEKTKPITGNNIEDVNISVTERSKPLKMSAQTVRQKLTELAAALAQTKDENDLNKVSNETKNRLKSAINSSADLTQIVLWLNKMAGLSKKK